MSGRAILGFGACLAMCLFAFFRGKPMPLATLSAMGLGLTAVCLVMGVARAEDGREAWGGSLPASWTVGWFAVALALGGGVGGAYRTSLGVSFFPQTLGWFVVSAALIGATEEWLYRGFIQGSIRDGERLAAVAFAAAGHTAYKCLLFAGRTTGADVHLGYLAAGTFLVGLLLGLLREGSDSVWPPVAAHAAFDVMVYGALDQAPWWVWQ